MEQSEVDVDFAVYYRFLESEYWLQNDFAQADIPSGEPVFIEIPRCFKSDGVQCDVVIRLKKSLYDQAEATRMWHE